MEVTVENLSNFILKEINLRVPEGEFFVLLGPNGAGKTTLLNALAGLIPYRGRVGSNGILLDDLPVERRGIGYLFQDLFLFPHLTVFQNITYGLQGLKNRAAREEKGREIMNLLNISQFKDRYPGKLSGGERQKVALGRALATDPGLLLLDEPFKSIDQRTTKYLMEELKNLQRKLRLTTIYVTHNLLEAEEMAGRLAVMVKGRILETGTADEILFNSTNQEVLDFIGSPNILPVDSFRMLQPGLFETRAAGLTIIVTSEEETISKLAVLPQDVYVSPFPIPGPDFNRFRGRIVRIEPRASSVRISIKVKDTLFQSDLNREIFDDFKLRGGDAIYLLLKFRWIKVYK